MIDVTDLTVRYDDVTALEGNDLSVEPGEFVTLIGPSGCGKTTLLRTIGGLVDPTSGRVSIDGEPPTVAQHDGNVGFVFQQHTLLPWKTAFENVTFLRRMAGKTSKPDDARDLLESFGLTGFLDVRPAELSGGMKQRVAIARALHLDADVLLMDEPFGELDEITREEMGIEVRSVWQRERKTVLFVTHSVSEAVFLADRCLVMSPHPGRITAQFSIDLPRPRDASIYESDRFQSHVATLRKTLHDHL